MPALINRQVRLKSRPVGIPQAENFELVSAAVPALQEGQVLVRNIYLSAEPAMLTEWGRAGQIRYREAILDGIEQAPDSIAGLYRGENMGKRLIRIAPEYP